MNYPLKTLHRWQRNTQKLSEIFFIFFAFCIPISLAMENVGIVLALTPAVLSGLWWTCRHELFSSTWIRLLTLLLVVFVIGVFYSVSDLHWSLKVLKKEGELIAILFFLPVVPDEETYLLQCLKSYIYGCLVIYGIAVLGNYHLLPSWAIFQHPTPYYGFFKIYAALFMAFGAFIALYLLVNKNTYRYWRFFWGLCFLLISYNVLWQSYSRTGYIIYFMLLFVFFITHTRAIIRVLGILCTLLLLLSIVNWSPHFQKGLDQVKSDYAYAKQGQMNTSAGTRMRYFADSLHLWKEKPIIGHGTGGYRVADVVIGGTTAYGRISTTAAPQVTPENTFYRIAVEQGLIGLILLSTLFLLQIHYSFFKLTGLRRKLAIGFIFTMIIASFSQDLILDESPRLFYILFTVLLYAPLWFRKNTNSLRLQ